MKLQNKTHAQEAFIFPLISGHKSIFFNVIPNSIVLQWSFCDAPKTFLKLFLSFQVFANSHYNALLGISVPAVAKTQEVSLWPLVIGFPE
jgi:hypothetical protein